MCYVRVCPLLTAFCFHIFSVVYGTPVVINIISTNSYDLEYEIRFLLNEKKTLDLCEALAHCTIIGPRDIRFCASSSSFSSFKNGQTISGLNLKLQCFAVKMFFFWNSRSVFVTCEKFRDDDWAAVTIGCWNICFSIQNAVYLHTDQALSVPIETAHELCYNLFICKITILESIQRPHTTFPQSIWPIWQCLIRL